MRRSPGKIPNAKVLKGKTVLMTRPRAQSAELKKKLQACGARVIEFPVIKILPPLTWKPLDRVIGKLERFDWLVFTSTNGVDVFFKRLRRFRKEKSLLQAARIAAIGQVTAERLKHYGAKAALCPKKFTTEKLFAAFQNKKQIQGRHFLLLRADIASDWLYRSILKAGGRVSEVKVYRTVPVSGRSKNLKLILKRNKIDFITFTSASTVTSFFDALSAKDQMRLHATFVAIGPVTGDALKKYGCRNYLEARVHTIPGLVDCMLRACD